MNKILNRSIMVMIVVLLAVAIVSPLFYALLHIEESTTQAIAADLAPEVSTQSINNAEKDIAFEIYSDEEVNQDNYKTILI